MLENGYILFLKNNEDVSKDRKHGEVKKTKSRKKSKDVKDRRAIHAYRLTPM